MVAGTLAATLAILPALGFAQDLGVPLSWRKFSNNRTLGERVSIAQNGINAILPQLNSDIGEFNGIGYWQSGNVWTAMANQDRFAGTTTNQAHVVNNLNKVFSLRTNYDQFGYFNDDALWWAQAAIEGYRAYKDNNLLSHAVATWNHVSNYVITQAQANAGSNPNKNFQLSGQCEGSTMAGGVFWRPTTDDQSVNSITTGLYISTSALLAEITGDSKYMNAAILSAQWIQNHNLNSNNIVLDTVNGHDCSRSPASWLFTYNSGKFLEGLSVLADVTGDSQWRSLMVTIAAAAMKNAPWQGSDGIITEGASPSSNNDGVGFKAIFIRGLCEVFQRNPSNNALRILIHSYGDVQYNALLDLAANGNTYSSNWLGPPQNFTTWGQLAALDVLVSNIITN
ncbi:Mannan endo-1,6-alpha-mannosidase DCW1 [Leucoagaricus sp. SymC.cos]|nr:Mannan endo-1,6-alpha-mannosidase DCW1 [Leucoagaricus sp. SymC.cos]